jgi:hypothetical protein
MSLMDKLEKRFGHWAVPNVMLGLIGTQLFVYAMVLTGRISFEMLPLSPKAVLAGEYWRVFSFIISPPHIAGGAVSALFLVIFWYILWMLSSALEASWGVFRFNLYLICGVFFTILGAFIGYFVSPSATIFIYPDFLYLSLFFAFAVLNPNFEFLVFFILPVKVKWLACFLGGMTGLSIIVTPSLGNSIATLGSILNFILFFRGALVYSVAARKRRNEFAVKKHEIENTAFHTCSQCGATDQSHPHRGFRYKSGTTAQICLCGDCREQL